MNEPKMIPRVLAAFCSFFKLISDLAGFFFKLMTTPLAEQEMRSENDISDLFCVVFRAPVADDIESFLRVIGSSTSPITESSVELMPPLLKEDFFLPLSGVADVVPPGWTCTLVACRATPPRAKWRRVLWVFFLLALLFWAATWYIRMYRTTMSRRGA